MQTTSISILTDPIPWPHSLFKEGPIRFARYIRNLFLPRQRAFNSTRFRGHFAVTRSLIEGLERLNVQFTYNPWFTSQLAKTVIVLAGVKTLRQAIKLKQLGIISR